MLCLFLFKLHLFVYLLCAGVHVLTGCSQSWRADDNLQELVLSYHWGTWVLRLSSKKSYGMNYLPGLTFSRSPTPPLSETESQCVTPDLSGTFGDPPVFTSPVLELHACGVTRVSHHHTCVTTYNLLLVKWTKSRVSQFAEIATNLHKRGNVLVFIVHTPSKSQVWGNIQVKQLSFINRWIVRRKKQDRKHSRIMTVDKEIGILLSSKWFGREKNFNLQN